MLRGVWGSLPVPQQGWGMARPPWAVPQPHKPQGKHVAWGLAGKMNYFGFLPALFSQPRCNVAVLCQGAFSPLHSCRIWCREYFELWLWLSQSCTSRARGTKDFSSFA